MADKSPFRHARRLRPSGRIREKIAAVSAAVLCIFQLPAITGLRIRLQNRSPDGTLKLEIMTERELFRHTFATLAYRSGEAIRGAPATFAVFDGAGKPPLEILAHIGDLFEWALRMREGRQEPVRVGTAPKTWERRTERFYATLTESGSMLASEEAMQAPVEKLFQGPIADALTHVGQLAMMRRMAVLDAWRKLLHRPDRSRAGRSEQAKAMKEF